MLKIDSTKQLAIGMPETWMNSKQTSEIWTKAKIRKPNSNESKNKAKFSK